MREWTPCSPGDGALLQEGLGSGLPAAKDSGVDSLQPWGRCLASGRTREWTPCSPGGGALLQEGLGSGLPAALGAVPCFKKDSGVDSLQPWGRCLASRRTREWTPCSPGAGALLHEGLGSGLPAALGPVPCFRKDSGVDSLQPWGRCLASRRTREWTPCSPGDGALLQEGLRSGLPAALGTVPCFKKDSGMDSLQPWGQCLASRRTQEWTPLGTVPCFKKDSGVDSLQPWGRGLASIRTREWTPCSPGDSALLQEGSRSGLPAALGTGPCFKKDSGVDSLQPWGRCLASRRTQEWTPCSPRDGALLQEGLRSGLPAALGTVPCFKKDSGVDSLQPWGRCLASRRTQEWTPCSPGGGALLQEGLRSGLPAALGAVPCFKDSGVDSLQPWGQCLPSRRTQEWTPLGTVPCFKKDSGVDSLQPWGRGLASRRTREWTPCSPGDSALLQEGSRSGLPAALGTGPCFKKDSGVDSLQPWGRGLAPRRTQEWTPCSPGDSALLQEGLRSGLPWGKCLASRRTQEWTPCSPGDGALLQEGLGSGLPAALGTVPCFKKDPEVDSLQPWGRGLASRRTQEWTPCRPGDGALLQGLRSGLPAATG
ncbi:hypothetical protein NDU88_005094 [Pleurodeles waltl]|uniref:Uncharacterized protein n=1 Tax=Pleurodeles waltl TaxID=8319 RepID=A0AAV7V4W4_PLEWA|nr:hypothetical protein NDU88_005094 [Pleurodeles waltl]